MTKLMEWLCGLFMFIGVWFYLLTSKNQTSQEYQLILFSPVILAGIFGVYTAFVILYRVYTFNNCEEAAHELQKEIQEANIELSKLGFKSQENPDKK
ncbi:dolichol-phosphate mannosyltransferase subunit 3 [Diorhabda sublineata]|uniref:dolichol-phosphate mannosyltransferase subunit 3 n=1 Tax=Diorhabda sublineata TaxID=1163346 RepID=UPI0024E1182E|nr:dolichol-phosphate mannosyltransferase subunit 3 [Diorhabda sublineata]